MLIPFVSVSIYFPSVRVIAFVNICNLLRNIYCRKWYLLWYSRNKLILLTLGYSSWLPTNIFGQYSLVLEFSAYASRLKWRIQYLRGGKYKIILIHYKIWQQFIYANFIIFFYLKGNLLFGREFDWNWCTYNSMFHYR